MSPPRHSLRLLHLADLHLDQPFPDLAPAAGRRQRQHQKQTLSRIVSLIQERDVDAVLVAGDLFDAQYVRPETVDFVIEQFERVPGCPVFIAPGPADPAGQTSYYRTAPLPDHVHVFLSRRPQAVAADSLPLTVHGAAVTGSQVRPPDWEDYGADASDGFDVLLSCGTAVDEAQAGIPVLSRAALAALEADYVALGGRHRQKLPSPSRTQPPVGEPGPPLPLDFSDSDIDRGVLLVTLSGADAKMEVIPISARQMLRQTIDISDCESEEAVVERLLQVIRRQGTDNLYHLSLVGDVEPSVMLDAEVLSHRLNEEAHYARCTDRSLPAYDLDRLKGEDDTLQGRFVKELSAAMAGAEQTGAADTTDRSVLRQALYLGLDALTQGEVRPQ